MRKIAVFGFGNPLLADDGFGYCLVKYLSRTNDFAFPIGIQGLYVIEDVGPVENVVFIDADLSLSPCSLAVYKIEVLNEKGLDDLVYRLPVTHRVTPLVVAWYMRKAGYLTKDAYMIAIGPSNLEPGGQMSDCIVELGVKAIEELAALLNKFDVELRLSPNWRDEVRKFLRECGGTCG